MIYSREHLICNTSTSNGDRESIGYVMMPRNSGYGAISATAGFIELMKEDSDNSFIGCLPDSGRSRCICQ